MKDILSRLPIRRHRHWYILKYLHCININNRYITGYSIGNIRFAYSIDMALPNGKRHLDHTPERIIGILYKFLQDITRKGIQDTDRTSHTHSFKHIRNNHSVSTAAC